MEAKLIQIRGARQHNLQNVDIDIPRDCLVVLTGLSGSGKSSLAFDTIYAEGQRKYVESLSVHARHFLEQVGKPDVDLIEGLPPTLAIEQRAAAVNPRSIVATTTEIYDFLRVLFARVGTPHCPNCGERIFGRTIEQMVDAVLEHPPDTRVLVLAPMLRADAENAAADLAAVLRRIQREGFVRARLNGELREVKDIAADRSGPVAVEAVVDRLVLRPDIRSRLSDALELGLGLGDGLVIVSHESRAGTNGAPRSAANGYVDEIFSERHACTRCGFILPELSPRAFSFNSPYGACEKCGGLGMRQRFDPQLIVPDERRSLTLAVAPWSDSRKKSGEAQQRALRALAAAFELPAETPFARLPEELKRIVLYGSDERDTHERGITFEGVIPNLERRARAAGADGGRGGLTAYMSEYVCEACDGARLKPAALAVRIDGRNIHEMTRLTIGEAVEIFEQLEFGGEGAQIAAPVLREVRQRLRFLNNVGLDYLTLDRSSGTLSGGEAQRIRLATQLGSGLVGVCYVLDEPTIGLHQRDNDRLLKAIRRLVDIGNTALVVEHDEDVIRAADYLIDMGPGAGLHGGRVIAAGPAEIALAAPGSLTGKFIRGEHEIPVPEERRPARRSEFVEVVGARQNNLKNITVRFPLGVFCAVTGVSGSGKSTLVSQILLPALRRKLFQSRERPGLHDRLNGANRIDKVIEVDQTPIGRTPRSNPATFTGVFDEVRRLYAQTKEAKLRGYSASRFTFNVKGGRCEACQGQGVRKIEMHFLPDVFVECQECKGTRYSRETLEIRYRGKSIADVLAMRVEESLRFFDNFPRIRQGLQALSDVGLGYIELGQPSNTLSGGEAQRVKLAGELARGTLRPLSSGDAEDVFAEEEGSYSTRPAPIAPQTARDGQTHTLYVLDEPTTGLHFADIQTLLGVLNRLVDMGNTVLVVEHNLDVIKTADWVIDLGPEGGEAGGEIVAEGPPETIARSEESYTGRYLRSKLAL